MMALVFALLLLVGIDLALADGINNNSNGTTGNASGISNPGAGGGSGPPQQPLRLIATNGGIGNSVSPANPRNQVIGRIPIVFGCNATQVVLSFDNWYINPQGSNNEAEDNPAAITIVKVALEKNGAATTTPILFNGLRSTTMAAGAFNVLSDPLTITIAQNQLYWLRVTATQPGGVSGAIWQYNNFANALFAGADSEQYPQVQDIDQVDNVGVLTVPTNSIALIQSFGPTAVLGRCPETGHPSVINVGASWSFGTDTSMLSATPGPTGPACTDTGTRTATGQGLMGAAALKGGVVTDPTGAIPFIKFVIGGSTAFQVINPPPTGPGFAWINKMQAYFKYANILFDDMGANDIGNTGQTPATIYANNKTLWTSARASGVQKVVVMQMTPRTTDSVDHWATLANQLVDIGFGNPFGTSDGEVLDALYNTNTVPTGTDIDGQFSAAVGGTAATGLRGSASTANANYWTFQVNGNAYAYTCAGLHPNAFTYPLVGAELRSVILGLTVN